MAFLHHRLRWLPLLITMGGIFYLSHLPGGSIHLPQAYNSDKLAHAAAYCTLGLCYLYALPSRWHRHAPWLAGGSVVIFCLLYGLMDEFHQSFVPGRMVSGADVMADGVGSLLAWACFAAWQRYRSKGWV